MDEIEKLLIALLIYIAISACVSLVFRSLCRRGFVFRAPRKRWVYYLLSFTWGLPATLGGLVIALALLATGHRPEMYGWDIRFRLKVNFGLSAGIVFISPRTCSTHLTAHEHGHSIQNIYFGPFMPGVVSGPSTMRFHWRNIRRKLRRPGRTSYDSAWFEGSATRSGKAFMERLQMRADTEENPTP